jgi:hypothetical protein
VVGFSFPPSYNPRHGYTLAQETVFWRREIQDVVGCLDEELHFAMDYDFFARIYLRYRIEIIPRLQGCFRCYAENKSTTMESTRQADVRVIEQRYFGGKPEGRWTDMRPVRSYSHLRVLLYPLTVFMPMVRRKLRTWSGAAHSRP